jgi:hypothetical protein
VKLIVEVIEPDDSIGVEETNSMQTQTPVGNGREFLLGLDCISP